MKAKEVMDLLRISRPTLSKYVKDGNIKVKELPNGRYDYDPDSVFNLLNNGVNRKVIIYARVSSPKQKAELENQVELLKQFCYANGYSISKIYSDIASGISFNKNREFMKMLDEILKGKVEKVVVYSRDRISRSSYDLFYSLCAKYNCKIVIMNEFSDRLIDSKEIFDEVPDVLSFYNIELCDSAKIKKMKKLNRILRNT